MPVAKNDPTASGVTPLHGARQLDEPAEAGARGAAQLGIVDGRRLAVELQRQRSLSARSAL